MDLDSEIDRLLADQAGRISAVTSRSTGLTAAAALAASVVAAQVSMKIEIPWWVIVLLSFATVAGVFVLLGTDLVTGPDVDKLLEWDKSYPSQLDDLVREARTIAIRANSGRVRFVEVAFTIQAVLVGAAVITALASIGNR